ncbi:MAG: diaminopimelate epimerase [Anaeromicrobium sp.]|jgi:diaminopimelate epimerase|uniref:diaminopimelate epimerase n=1 Tax=Anaeromicrobium sp. TaxID=1929132 RepID=UPI0025F27A6D|nr:diaminopimelate epimerase [Anaeromicrobium sp.]MCT4594168.1 diaminopimelate epimerase [Anaeromicrobium sp.]
MKFTKMQAAGNDFILINGFEYEIDDYNGLAKKVCDRHFGIGADGLMVCKDSNVADIEMRYYNSDGSRGEMCGNGIRCFSKFIYDNNILKKEYFKVETLGGIKTIWIDETDGITNTIKVDMERAIFEAQKVPVNMGTHRVIEEKISLDGKDMVISSILVGVPHTVIIVEDLKNTLVNELGRKIENLDIFPRKTNVNFIEILDRNTINIATWERGAGRTLGCGTGSCASVVIGHLLGKLDEKVLVNTEGGKLTVEIGSDYEIYMTGDANTICIGQLKI